jgi:septal ring factor EnvC (AmiA/AmiB activator)
VIRRRVILFVLTAALSTCFFILPLTFGQQKQEREQQLKKLDEEINRLRGDIQAITGEEESTIRSIERLKMENRLHLKEVERLGLEITDTEEQIAVLEEEAQALEVSLKGRQKQLGLVLRRLYISGHQGMLRSLLSIPQPNEIGLAQSYLSAIAGREMKFIDGYKRDIESLQRRQDALRKARSDLGALENQEREHSQEALRAGAEQEKILDQIRTKRGIYDKALSEKLEARRALQRLIEELTTADSEATIHFAEYQGRLAWPCPGDVITGFGQVHDQVYDVVLENDGIDIKAPLGTPVNAVFQGKVIFCNWTDGRGNIVVIDHGNSFYSLYAHLDRFDVSLGDSVAAGQQVGTVGETGSLKGSVLHFEIRRHAIALDPISWLRKR